MYKHLLLIFSLTTSSFAYGGNIADIFANDIFGVPWGSSIQTVESAFPEGRKDAQIGIIIYTIDDGRELFGIKREPDNFIQYHINPAGGTHSVAIQFPLNSEKDYEALLKKLSTHFGKYDSMPGSSGASYARWPTDEGITIGLSYTPGSQGAGELLFGIEYHPAPKSITREQLGF